MVLALVIAGLPGTGRGISGGGAAAMSSAPPAKNWRDRAMVAGGAAGRVVAPEATEPALPGQVNSGWVAAAAGHAPASGAISAAAAKRAARRDMAAPDGSNPF